MVESLGGHIYGKRRLELLRYHRLYAFLVVWDLYLQGRMDPATVKRRAKAMLAAGLPERL